MPMDENRGCGEGDEKTITDDEIESVGAIEEITTGLEGGRGVGGGVGGGCGIGDRTGV